MNVKRRLFLAAPLFLAPAWLLGPRAALAASEAGTSKAGTPEAAPIEALDAALISIMKAGSSSFQTRYDMLAPVVENVFNLDQILQFSVGLLWSSIPADQQAKLATVFEQYTVASYVKNFNAFDGQSFKILPTERNVGAERIVESEIVPASGDPTRLDYVMKNIAGRWQAVDVLLEGTISKVAVQRSDFSSLVSPGNAGQLISDLQSKVRSLSNGALHG